MFEKTKKFLKKVDGKHVEPINDYYLDICIEKGATARFLDLSLRSYMLTLENKLLKEIKIANPESQCPPLHIEIKENQKFRDRLREISALHTGDEFHAAYNKHEYSSLDDDAAIGILVFFSSPKYETPDNVPDLWMQAQYIDFYYSKFLPAIGFHSWQIDAKIDLALLNIAVGICFAISCLDLDITKYDHAKPGVIGKKAKAADATLDARTYFEKLNLDLTTKEGRKAAISALTASHTIDKIVAGSKHINRINSTIAGVTEKTARKYVDNIIKMDAGKADNQKG